MKQGDGPTNAQILAATYGVLLGLATIPAVLAFLLAWVACLGLSEIAKVDLPACSCRYEHGAQVQKRTLKEKLPQSANATRRKHNVRQG
jgi:hypothetical protein